MPGNWTLSEVEAIVADYFAMLELELRGQTYSKTKHRRNLQRLLNNRTDGSIERKHQNISAVLIACGYPYIPGYKPLSNYQELLRQVVLTRLAGATQLTDTVRSDVQRQATVPPVRDILALLESPPTGEPPRSPRTVEAPGDWKGRRAYHTDFLALEARNRSLGGAGEDFVVEVERARLVSVGHPRLADRVERVSVTHGDGLGFDVLSYEPSGRELFIEVKTTAFGKETPFFVSRNELEFSRRNESGFHLHRLFEFRRNPRLFTLPGSLMQTCDLEEEQYRARVKPR